MSALLAQAQQMQQQLMAAQQEMAQAEVTGQAGGGLVVATVKGTGLHRTYPNWVAREGMRGMDVTVQAMSGVVTTTGFPDGAPVKAGPAVVDFAAGSHLTSAVLAALFQRERTGLGQRVEVAMQDAVINFNRICFAGQLMFGKPVPRTGAGDRPVALQGLVVRESGLLTLLNADVLIAQLVA